MPIPTVQQYAVKWLTRLRGRVREHSRLKYAWTLEHYVLPLLGETPLSELTRAAVRDVMAAVMCIKRADSVLGTDHSRFVNRALRDITGPEPPAILIFLKQLIFPFLLSTF